MKYSRRLALSNSAAREGFGLVREVFDEDQSVGRVDRRDADLYVVRTQDIVAMLLRLPQGELRSAGALNSAARSLESKKGRPPGPPLLWRRLPAERTAQPPGGRVAR